jgi:2-keto-4-pentenoate hydratase
MTAGARMLLPLAAHVSPAVETQDALIGWKAGLGGAETVAALGLRGPLVGRLFSAGRLASGAEVSIAGWVSARLEPEIAVVVDRDLAGDETVASLEGAIRAAMPAFEIVDVRGPLDDVPRVVDANVYQRAVVLGVPTAPADALCGAIPLSLHEGARTLAERARATDAIGDIRSVVTHVARAVAAAGDVVRAGQIIMTGSLVPPVALHRGRTYRARLGGLGAVDVRTAP